MKRAAKISAVGLMLTIAAAQCVTAEAATLGRLRGVVQDQTGSPLVGAVVAIFDAASKADRPVRNATTDESGRFEAAVAPGRYILRAAAYGFGAYEARARVAANRETVIDPIALRRTNTLADRRRADSDGYRQVVRSARGHVFHIDEVEDPEPVPALALTDTKDSTQGVVQMVASSGDSNYVATNFAVSRRIAGSDVTIAGQAGLGEGAPQRFEARTATDIGDSHRLEATFGYGRMLVRGDDAQPFEQLDQFTVQAEDRWQVAGPLVLVYGFNFTRFAGASDATAILPRLGVEFAATSRTQVFAGLVPGSTPDEIASFDLETGEVTFVAPPSPNVVADRIEQATPDRSRRIQVGVGHLINERSNIEVMAFFDTVTGHGVGFLAVPTRGADSQFHMSSLEGETTGMRVVYTCRLTRVLTGRVGYAVGTGLHLSPGDLDDPASLYRSARFQMVAGQLQADFGTGTRVTAVYRFAPDTVVFGIDPFAGRLAASEPSASFFVVQTLPMPDFFPGQWEALVDVRNLFDVAPSTDDRELVFGEYSRLVRAGLSFRF